MGVVMCAECGRHIEEDLTSILLSVPGVSTSLINGKLMYRHTWLLHVCVHVCATINENRIVISYVPLSLDLQDCPD